nr:unnamed protein product [Callosobruchus analis]
MCDIRNSEIRLIYTDNSTVGGDNSSDSCISDGEMDSEPPPSSPKSSTPTFTGETNGNRSSTGPTILSPLVYQTPQGVMYAATPSGGGVILGVAQPQGGAAHTQFITIPLSMMGTSQQERNGQSTELDLSKRK